MTKYQSVTGLAVAGFLMASSVVAADHTKSAAPYRHRVSQEILIEHKDLSKVNWMDSKTRLEYFQNEERIATAPATVPEMARVFCANFQTHLFSIGLTAGAYVLTSRLLAGAVLARGQPNNAALVAAAAGGGIGALVLSKQTGDLVEAIKKGLNFKLEYLDAMKLLKARLFHSSQDLVPYLPVGLREALEKLDRSVVSALNAHDTGSANKLLRAREKVFLAVPLFTRPINSKASAAVEAKFQRVVERTLPENHATIESLIHAMEDNSKLHSQRELPDGTPAGGIKTVVFLNGPRGTGKTEFVRDLAAAAGFDEPCIIKLAELENVFELVGTGDYGQSGPTDRVIGRILNCVLEAGVANPIIFFEEASNTIGAEVSRAIMQQSASEMNNSYKKMAFLEILKTLFEKDTTSAAFRLNGLMGAPYDISRITFILAGNFPLHKDLSSGGRVTNVYFGPLTTQQKTNAVHDELNAQLARLDERPEDRALIQERFNEKMQQFIITKDENRFIPGARIIKSVVQKSVAHLLHKRNLSESDLKQYIGHAFSTEDKRDLLERKNDALAIAVSRQEVRLREPEFSFEGRVLSKVEISRIIETLREAQEHIQISASTRLPEPQAIAARIDELCSFIISKVAMRDREKYSDDEIETFAISEREFYGVIGALFMPRESIAMDANVGE